MAGHTNHEQYDTGVHGQSHESRKVWHRSVWAVTQIMKGMTQVFMTSHTNRIKCGTGLYGQSHESCEVWYRSAWPVIRIVNSMVEVCMASHVNRVQRDRPAWSVI